MRKRNFIVIVALLLVILGGYNIIRIKSLKEINKLDINVSEYIDYVDEESANKLQINWKEVAAILAVEKKNKLKEVSPYEIKKISNMFIEENNNKYKLNSIDEVMDKLKFKEKEKKRAYDYIDDLKEYGIRPQKLQEDTKYMQFINSIKEGAINNYEKYKVLPSITIAQAILETGWGESILASEFNNLFGIKADKSWKGEYVTLETKEFSDTIIDDRFRKYEDKDQSIYDHAQFLYENKRYKDNGVFEANTYKVQANALQDAGYSTHMNEKGEKIYAKQLIQLIQQYNLQLIDNEAQINKK